MARLRRRSMQSRSTFVALCLLFVCSGACGLTYQVLWLRLLALVFGVTVHAASTVLAAFMAGLALGSLLAERLARRGHPLRVFAALEAGIAVSALATPVLLGAAAGLYRPLSALAGDSLWVLTAGRFVASFAVLLVPTVLMGATLPVLSRADLVRASGARLGALYAVNTTGAVAGALLTGFVLIGGIGIQRTFLLAASLNLAVAGVAWWLSTRAPLPVAAEVARHRRSARPSRRRRCLPRLVLGAMAVSGVASLALEIVWFRILVQFLPATSYAFTTMLATVLGGIAIGSALASRALTRRPRLEHWCSAADHGRDRHRRAAVAGGARRHLRRRLARPRGWRRDRPRRSCRRRSCMGFAFPIALALWTRPARPADATVPEVGTLYAANVVGGIAGAVLGGFVLLPWLGSRRALIVCAALYLAASVVLLAATLRRGWPRSPSSSLFAPAAGAVPDPFDAALARRHGRGERIFWKEEGVQTSVSIHTHAFRGWLMYLDGLHQASDAPEMVRLHRLIGHLPMVLHPAPRRALVVGLGGGATPGAVSQHDADVLVVELSDTVRKGAAFFKHVNYDLFARPNVHVRVDDGRNFLSLTDQRFDVVTADLIQPIHAGAGNLYSREYFQLVHDAVADDGLVLQWIGHRPESQYKLIMRTFLDVFPYTTLWLDGQLMVGGQAAAADLAGDVRGQARPRRDPRRARRDRPRQLRDARPRGTWPGPTSCGASSARGRCSPTIGRWSSTTARCPPASRWCDLHGVRGDVADDPRADDRARRRAGDRHGVPRRRRRARAPELGPGRRARSAATASPSTRRRLIAAEPHAKLEMDRGALMARTDDRRRGWIYFDTVLRHAGIAPDEATDRALAEMRAYHDVHNLWEHVPADVAPALAALRALGVRLVVVSNANGTLRALFDRVGLTAWFDVVLDSHEWGVEKPDPRLFHLALAESGADAATTVHVGDFFHIDVDGARAAGLAEAVLFDPADLYADADCPGSRGSPELAALVARANAAGALERSRLRCACGRACESCPRTSAAYERR